MALIGLILIVSATFGGLLGFSGLTAAEPASSTILGLVENENGQGLDDVSVVAFNPDAGGSFASTLTVEGEFLLTGLDPGHYVVRFTHDEYLSDIVFTSLNPGEKYQLEETLEMVDTTDFSKNLTGTITDMGTTDPIEDAMVMLIDDNGNIGTSYFDTPQPHHYLTYTNDQGEYSFTDMLYTGAYDLRVSADGYYTDVTSIGIATDSQENVSLVPAEEHYVKIYVEDEEGIGIDPDDVDVLMYEYSTGTWTDAGKSVLSHRFWPQDGKYLFIAEPEDDSTYNSGALELDVDDSGSHTIVLTDKEKNDRDHTFEFTDWDTFTYSMDFDMAFDEGRAFGENTGRDLLEPMTGLLYFDVDRIWGDNDGTADDTEFDAYVAWEEDLDAGMTYIDEDHLKVKDDGWNSYEYAEGTYSIELSDANGDPLDNMAVHETDATFNLLTVADYTADLDELDEYQVKILIPNLQDDTPDLSYYFDWSDDFETTANTTNKTSGAIVTGTPNTLIVPGEAPEDHEDAEDGYVTLTVSDNELPTPVIDILTSLTQVEYLDADDELMKVWVVDSLTQVNFTGEDSTDSQEITNYTWTFTGAQVTERYGVEVNNTFDDLAEDNNNVTIELTVSDAHGENSTTVDIYVDDTDPTAIFNMTVKHAAGADGDPYTFNATDGRSNLDENPVSSDVMVFDAGNSTDAGFLGQNALVKYEWLFSDDETIDGPIVSRAFKDPGEYTVTLTVTDAAGNNNNMSEDFIVNDIEPPEAAYTWCGYNETGNCTPDAGFVGRPYEFNASTTEDNSGVVTSYIWDVTRSADDVEDQFTIEEFLFSLATAEHTNDLMDGEVTTALENAFATNGVELEDGAMLQMAPNAFASLLGETHWHIETEDGGYTLKDNGTTVDVYSSNASEEAQVVFITFLEYKDEGYSVTLTVSDGDDNQAQYMRTIIPARPDLPDLFSPNIVMDPETVNEGDTVTFEVDIKLLGRNVTDDFHVSFYKDEIGQGNLLDNVTVTPDEINGAEDQTLTLTVEWIDPSPGDRTFIVFVDSGNEIYEGDLDEKVETNNQQFTPFFVIEEEDEPFNKWLIIGILGVVAFLAIAGYYFFIQRPGYYDDE